MRQPLNALRIKDYGLRIMDGEMLRILKDELNVNEIIFDKNIANEAELDTELTPELRVAGLVRGLERSVQELRKKNGFNVGEMAELHWATTDDNSEESHRPHQHRKDLPRHHQRRFLRERAVLRGQKGNQARRSKNLGFFSSASVRFYVGPRLLM